MLEVLKRFMKSLLRFVFALSLLALSLASAVIYIKKTPFTNAHWMKVKVQANGAPQRLFRLGDPKQKILCDGLSFSDKNSAQRAFRLEIKGDQKKLPPPGIVMADLAPDGSVPKSAALTQGEDVVNFRFSIQDRVVSVGPVPGRGAVGTPTLLFAKPVTIEGPDLPLEAFVPVNLASMETIVDGCLRWIKNQPVFAGFIIVCGFFTGVATFFKALRDIGILSSSKHVESK